MSETVQEAAEARLQVQWKSPLIVAISMGNVGIGVDRMLREGRKYQWRTLYPPFH